VNSTADKDFSRYFLVFAFLLLAFACAYIVAPFVSSLFAAVSVALLLAPVFESLSARAPRHRSAVAAALTASASLLAAVPFFIGGWTILHEAAQAYPAARSSLEALAGPGAPSWTPPPRWAPVLETGRDYASALNINPRAFVLENLDQVSAWAAKFARTMVRNTALVVINIAVFTASLFLFLRDGGKMVRRGTELIPLPPEKTAHLLARARDALLAVVSGIFAIALLQGALAWAGLALLGVPFAGLLGMVCVLLSPIPFVGSALVAAPVALIYLLSGATAKAAAIALWFALVVGLSDNLVRPVLIGSRMRLPIPVVFIGVIGAMKAFGLGGLFIGPVVIALAYGFLDILKRPGPEER